MLYRDFQPWGKPYLHTWKITIVFHVFEIANQLLTYHSLFSVPWMNYNAFSFWNMNKVNFFLLVRSLYNKQNKTWLLGDMEFLSSCSTWYLTWSLHTLVRYWVEHLKNHLVKYKMSTSKVQGRNMCTSWFSRVAMYYPTSTHLKFKARNNHKPDSYFLVHLQQWQLLYHS